MPKTQNYIDFMLKIAEDGNVCDTHGCYSL